MGRPLMARFPGNRDDEDGELEKPPIELGAEAKRLSDRRPMKTKRGVVQKSVERPGQIALIVDERAAGFRARAADDGIVKLFLLGREIAAVDCREPAHCTSEKLN